MTTNKTEIITYHNVLNPLERTIVTDKIYKNIDEILKDLKYDNGIYDLVVSRNSVIEEGFFEINPGDIINITIVPKGGGGGGKKIIGIVAMIAITIVSYGAGAAYGASVGSALGVSTATGTAIVSATVAAVGGLLVNALMPKPNMSLDFNKQDFKNSQTYSWARATNQAMQSAPIPKIFGTHKITPPLIASYIEVIDSKQYFNGLYALNDGLIKSVSDIKINNESVTNFKNVTYEIRKGELTQELIPSFNDTSYDKPVSKKLDPKGEYSYTSTDGNFVTAFIINFVMPRGIYAANDRGGLDELGIPLSIEYSTDNKNWIVESMGISGATTAAVRKTFKKTGLAASRYYIRVKHSYPIPDSSRYATDCYIEYITEIISDDFIYPRTALLAVRALATGQLSGSAPNVSAVVSANSDNPAYVAKQILIDSGITEDKISPGFEEWAKFCDEKKLRCNIVFDSELSVAKALDTIGLLGRASVLQAGSKFDVIMDKAGLIPVQSFLFGMGNILKDSFKQTFLPIVNRANFIEVTYYDKNKDYEPTIVSVTNTTYDTATVINKTGVTLVGCTDEEQARSYGRFQINCNRYLTETIEFEADKDSLVCRYGDIIKVSHDTPQYGFSGRLLNDSENGVIELDRDIEMQKDKTYAIQIKNDKNEVKEFQILARLEPNKIKVDMGADTFKKYDNYAFGEINKVSKLYRILKISTGGEFTRHITAIEYNEDIYNDSAQISSENKSSLQIRNLRASDYIKLDLAKNIRTFVSIAWSGNALSYDLIYKQKEETAYKSVKLYDSFFEFEAIDGKTYEISVSDALGSRASIEYTVQGKIAKPPKASNIQAKETKNEWVIEWQYKDRPIDFKEFEIYENNVLVQTTTLNRAKLAKDKLKSVITIVAVDTSNVKSDSISLNLNVSQLPKVSNFEISYKSHQQNVATWQSLGDELSYEIRRGEEWQSAQRVYLGSQTTANLEFNGSYLLKAFYINEYGLRVESAQPCILVIDESKAQSNVTEVIKFPKWSGKFIDTQIYNDALCLAGDYKNPDVSKRKLTSMEGFLECEKIVALKSIKTCEISSSIAVSGLNLNMNFDMIENVDAIKNIDNLAGEVDNFSAQVQICVSLDGENWSPYEVLKDGRYEALAFKFRLTLASNDIHITPFISACNIVVDMPDVFESGSGISDSKEIEISYEKEFSIAPKVQIIIIDANAGDDAVLMQQSAKGFKIKILNKNGNAVKRKFNYIAKGY
ncbi:TipJ family phage tail tip protein [Campylobacter curvus]|uniref:TipJ family phage tail tip protein n=2 Tax=Campylobacter TaxID=194 RepID=UPI001470397D|nr:phage tail protein [Campylobacter curvus]